MANSKHETFSPKLTVYGCGYVGVTVATCLAAADFDVHCVEPSAQRLHELLTGRSPDGSAKTEELILRGVASGRLRFTARQEDSVEGIIFLCVGTPLLTGGAADLSAVYEVVNSIVTRVTQDTFVFVKSTVPPGTCVALQQLVDAASPSHNIEIIANPEFLREGSTLEDFMTPDRVVIGARSQSARECARSVYGRLLGSSNALQFVTRTSAELAKYASNAMLATRVALMNDIAIIAEQSGAEIEDVRRIVGMDSRIGPDFITSGCGFGGSCLGKDLHSLENISGSYLQSGLLGAVLKANRQHQLHALSHLREFFGESLSGLRGALWGLAYKSGVNDTRDSPALAIAGALQQAGVILRVFDPAIVQDADIAMMEGVEFAKSALDAATKADFVVVCTAWDEFKLVQPAKLHKAMSQPIIVDACNTLHPKSLTQLGFHYRGMGRSDFG